MVDQGEPPRWLNAEEKHELNLLLARVNLGPGRCDSNSTHFQSYATNVARIVLGSGCIKRAFRPAVNRIRRGKKIKGGQSQGYGMNPDVFFATQPSWPTRDNPEDAARLQLLKELKDKYEQEVLAKLMADSLNGKLEYWDNPYITGAVANRITAKPSGHPKPSWGQMADLIEGLNLRTTVADPDEKEEAAEEEDPFQQDVPNLRSGMNEFDQAILDEILGGQIDNISDLQRRVERKLKRKVSRKAVEAVRSKFVEIVMLRSVKRIVSRLQEVSPALFDSILNGLKSRNTREQVDYLHQTLTEHLATPAGRDFQRRLKPLVESLEILKNIPDYWKVQKREQRDREAERRVSTPLADLCDLAGAITTDTEAESARFADLLDWSASRLRLNVHDLAFVFQTLAQRAKRRQIVESQYWGLQKLTRDALRTAIEAVVEPWKSPEQQTRALTLLDIVKPIPQKKGETKKTNAIELAESGPTKPGPTKPGPTKPVPFHDLSDKTLLDLDWPQIFDLISGIHDYQKYSTSRPQRFYSETLSSNASHSLEKTQANQTRMREAIEANPSDSFWAPFQAADALRVFQCAVEKVKFAQLMKKIPLPVKAQVLALLRKMRDVYGD